MKKSKRIRFHRPERDRMMFKILRRISELTPTEATRGTSVSPQTITNWRMPVKSGGTRFPQLATLELVAKANGMKIVLMDDDGATQQAAAGVSHYAA